MFDWRARPRPTLPALWAGGATHTRAAHARRRRSAMAWQQKRQKKRRTEGTQRPRAAPGRTGEAGDRRQSTRHKWIPTKSFFFLSPSPPPPSPRTYSLSLTRLRQDDRHPFPPQQHGCHCAPSAAIRNRLFFHPGILTHSHQGLCICSPHQRLLEEARKRWKVLGHIGCVHWESQGLAGSNEQRRRIPCRACCADDACLALLLIPRVQSLVMVSARR